jgi:hypothetical protein
VTRWPPSSQTGRSGCQGRRRPQEPWPYCTVQQHQSLKVRGSNAACALGQTCMSAVCLLCNKMSQSVLCWGAEMERVAFEHARLHFIMPNVGAQPAPAALAQRMLCHAVMLPFLRNNVNRLLWQAFTAPKRGSPSCVITSTDCFGRHSQHPREVVIMDHAQNL